MQPESTLPQPSPQSRILTAPAFSAQWLVITDGTAWMVPSAPGDWRSRQFLKAIPRDPCTRGTGRDCRPTLIASSTPLGSDDGRLRRAQALAATAEVGMSVMRDILRRKLLGQARVATGIDDETADRISVDAETLDMALSLKDLRRVEAHAAGLYLTAWESIPMNFSRKDAKRVPPRWATVGNRVSPLSASSRKAATPANAILIYLYAILEAETRIAL